MLVTSYDPKPYHSQTLEKWFKSGFAEGSWNPDTSRYSTRSHEGGAYPWISGAYSEIYVDAIRMRLSPEEPVEFRLHERDRGRYTLRELVKGSSRLVGFDKHEPVTESIFGLVDGQSCGGYGFNALTHVGAVH